MLSFKLTLINTNLLSFGSWVYNSEETNYTIGGRNKTGPQGFGIVELIEDNRIFVRGLRESKWINLPCSTLYRVVAIEEEDNQKIAYYPEMGKIEYGCGDTDDVAITLLNGYLNELNDSLNKIFLRLT